jgi:Transposase DDE domain group 1
LRGGKRRVVDKVEHAPQTANCRFVVAALSRARTDATGRLFCARGEAENRIGEQFELWTDRTP